MFCVYILQSLKDGRTYIGSTRDLERRIKEHNSGRVISTRNRIPFRLILKEIHLTSLEMKRRELWWKSGAGRRKLQEIFEELAS